jgi:hypothetical protein
MPKSIESIKYKAQSKELEVSSAFHMGVKNLRLVLSKDYLKYVKE